MNKISYSQYTMWENCPMAWKLKYVDGHRLDDASIHTVFGTSMHEAIQDWLDTLYNGSEVVAKTVDLHEGFKENFIKLFKESTEIDEDGNKLFLSDKKTLMEFYDHGCKILSYVQQNYKKIFPTKNVKLHSIEFPLEIEVQKGVQYVGYVDVITYNEKTGKYVLYDLKTSTRGWSSYQKNDPVKRGQLILYKKFFAEQVGVDLDNISVEFIILKRIISEDAPFPIPRVSKFVPPNGKPTLNNTWRMFERFITSCFNESGEYISEQNATPSKQNCRWCKYKDRKDLCPYGV